MKLDYFKYCKELLIELHKAIDSNDNFKIYQLIPSLIPVVAITYYCLTEDIIITRDDKNPDTNTRFKLNVPNYLIDKLFENEEWIKITKKMTDSHLWLLSGIRNSIMHGSSVIDIKNNKLTIDNKSFKNQLECEIDLDWFINYLMQTDVDHNYISENFSILFAESINQIDKSKKLNDLSTNYIYANLIHFFKVNIKSKDNNPEPIPRDTFIRHIFKYIQEYLDTLHFSMEENKELSFINCLKKGLIRKENETEDEFNARVFKHFFKKHLKINLENNFPNYEFEVQAVRPKVEFKDLLDEDKISYVLKQEKLEEQTRYASAWITNKLMNNLIKPFEEESFFREFINTFFRIDSFKQPEYITDAEMVLLLSNNSEDVEIGETSILKRIKGYNVFANKTYDKVILRKIIMQDFKGPDLLVAMNLLRELRYEFDYFGYEEEEALTSAKMKCPYLFDKYTAILKQQNGMSDQDLVTYHNQPLDEIRDLNYLLNQNKKELVKMIIYLTGINCYILNKESIFDADNNIYESIIDDTFEGYSKTVYDHEYHLAKQSFDTIITKLEKQTAKQFSDKTPQLIIDKYNEETRKLLELKSEIEERLSKFEIKEIVGTNMVKVDKKNTSTLIRNSISHPERIEILDDLTIKLNDFDNKGILSGVVYVPLNNLLNFFLNDAFDKKLSEGKQNESKRIK